MSRIARPRRMLGRGWPQLPATAGQRPIEQIRAEDFGGRAMALPSAALEALAGGGVLGIRQVPTVQLGMLRLFRLVRDGEELRQEDGFG